MSDDKILDLGKLPLDYPDSPIASMKISIATNGGYALEIQFEDNRHPMTFVFPDKIELLALLNQIILR